MTPIQTVYTSSNSPTATKDREPVSPDLVSRLRRMIRNGDLVPGQHLTKAGLVQTLGVGRTPLREALRMLEAEGLVVAERNRRPRVSALDPAELDSIYAGRIMIAVLGVALTVAKLSDADLAGVKAVFEAMNEAESQHDLATWERLHTEFHHALVIQSGRELLRILVGYDAQTERYRKFYLRTENIQPFSEHQSLLAAFVDRDVELAVERMAQHFAHTALTVMTHVEPRAEPRAIREALRLVTAKGLSLQPTRHSVGLQRPAVWGPRTS